MPKLNYDCIRDILLTVQDIEFNRFIKCNEFSNYPLLSAYSYNEFVYHVTKLGDENYLDVQFDPMFHEPYRIFDLTWNGHELIQSIGNDSVYNKTKDKIFSTVGSVSIEVFKLLATETSKNLLGLK